MKKYMALMAANLAVVLLITFLFFGEKPENQPLVYRFTMIYPENWEEQGQQFPEVLEIDGANLRCVRFRESQEEEQIEAIQKAIYAHADGIITVGTSTSQQLEDAINAAAEADIPVVLVDSDLPGTKRAAYAGADNRSFGEMAGRELAEATGEKANIGILVSLRTNPGQAEREQGFCREIASRKEMRVVGVTECGTDRIRVRKTIQEMLRAYPQIDALFCADALSSEMVGEILQSEEYSDRKIQVVCSGMTEQILGYLSENICYSAILQDGCRQYRLAAACLKACLNRERMETDTLYTELICADETFDYEAWKEKEKGGETVWR